MLVKSEPEECCQANANFSPKVLLAKITRHKFRAISQLNFGVTFSNNITILRKRHFNLTRPFRRWNLK